jgi:glycine/D-amino acid oxidase-like deaminating enzyme
MQPEVIIVGGGIAGAMLCFELSCAGVQVRLIEAATRPGSGVSARSFGWINAINSDPEGAPGLFALRRDGLERFAALNQRCGGALAAASAGGSEGALLWQANGALSAALRDKMQVAGYRVDLLQPAQAAGLLPGARLPDLVLHVPQELAVRPAHVCKILLERAVSRGAEVICGQRVDAVATRSGRVTGVICDGRLMASPQVVVAAGLQSRELLAAFTDPGWLQASPAALVELSADLAPFVPVVRTPDIELRSLGSGRFLAVTSAPDPLDPQAGKAVAQAQVAALQDLFPEAGQVRAVAVNTGQRPLPSDGRPRAGRVAAVEGLYVMVGHPGVILAPVMAASLCDQILGRRGVPLSEPL